MSDYMVSLIRTWVPVFVGAGITWLGSTFGVFLSDDTSQPLTLAIVAVVIAIYYAAARAAEKRWPFLGQVLLALGLVKAKPIYHPPVT